MVLQHAKQGRLGAMPTGGARSARPAPAPRRVGNRNPYMPKHTKTGMAAVAELLRDPAFIRMLTHKRMQTHSAAAEDATVSPINWR